MKQKIVNLPLSYSVVDFDSDRFLKLRVKVMHTGLNLNRSSFDLDAIEKARPTLANVPLLAFVKKTDGSDGGDFAGHEFEIKITSDGVKYSYLGRPVGMVPETNNYSLVQDEETGKIFVEVDAYLWKDYANEALDIFQRDGEKKVSMEINVKDYDEDEFNYFKIKDYSYTGIALLGDDVQEAMIGAKAEIANYSATQQSLTEMMFALKEDLVAADKQTETFEEEKEEEVEEQEQTQEQEQEEFAETIIEPEIEESIEAEPETIEEFESEITEEIEPTVDYQAIIQELQNENAELKAQIAQFESEKTSQLKQEIIEEFEDLEGLEEFSAIAQDTSLDLDTLKLKLFALRGQESSKQTQNPISKLVYNHLGIEGSGSNEPSWAGLVRQNIQKN